MALSRSLRWCLLAALLAVPLLELTAHALILAHVPAPADYAAAAGFIRSQLSARDLIASAPSFIDPIVRWQLGDAMSLAMAGRSDDAAYQRMWVLSIRGSVPADAPAGAPELRRSFGEVEVLRYALPKAEVLFDFVAAWPEASASIVRAGVSKPCPLRSGGWPRGGGLGRGVLMPVNKRFECDARAQHLFVGDVVLEDLNNQPRHCIWQHPQGTEPVQLTFRDVPLGAALVFYGGIYYEHERMREGGPIDAVISIDGQVQGRFRHVDGDGFRSLRIDTRALGKARGEVSVAVTAPDPRARSFCWAATTRGPETARAAADSGAHAGSEGRAQDASTRAGAAAVGGEAEHGGLRSNAGAAAASGAAERATSAGTAAQGGTSVDNRAAVP